MQGGLALSALALVVMTGAQAAGESEDAVEVETLAAIESTIGEVLDTAVQVSGADAVVVTGHGATVELSADPVDGVSLTTGTDEQLEVGLPFASEADTAAVIDGTVVYDNNNGSTTTPLVLADGSVQILTTIADASAPSSYAYEFPSDVALISTGDGGIDVVGTDGGVVQHVEAPWAYDANGSPVETRYIVAGNTLIQEVPHGQGVVYPVVADPKFTQTWWNKTLYFNKTESAVVAAGAGSAAWIANYFGLPGKVISGAFGGYASAFTVYTAAGKCGKLVWYVGYPAPVPQPYWGNEAGGYCK